MMQPPQLGTAVRIGSTRTSSIPHVVEMFPTEFYTNSIAAIYEMIKIRYNNSKWLLGVLVTFI